MKSSHVLRFTTADGSKPMTSTSITMSNTRRGTRGSVAGTAAPMTTTPATTSTRTRMRRRQARTKTIQMSGRTCSPPYFLVLTSESRHSGASDEPGEVCGSTERCQAEYDSGQKTDYWRSGVSPHRYPKYSSSTVQTPTVPCGVRTVCIERCGLNFC